MQKNFIKGRVRFKNLKESSKASEFINLSMAKWQESETDSSHGPYFYEIFFEKFMQADIVSCEAIIHKRGESFISGTSEGPTLRQALVNSLSCLKASTIGKMLPFKFSSTNTFDNTYPFNLSICRI